jgi:hypothetical protein
VDKFGVWETTEKLPYQKNKTNNFKIKGLKIRSIGLIYIRQ